MGNFAAIVERFPYTGLFLLPIMGSVGFPLPEDAILILCGVLISRNIIATLPGLAAVYSGILVSDLLIYSFGKKYCRRILSHRRLQKIFPPEKIILLEQRFIRSGPLLILLCRQIFWVRAKLFLVAGIMKMPLHRFIIVDAIAALITAGIMVTLGYAGYRSFHYADIIAREITQLAPQLAAILTSLLLVWWFFSWRQRKTAA